MIALADLTFFPSNLYFIPIIALFFDFKNRILRILINVIFPILPNMLFVFINRKILFFIFSLFYQRRYQRVKFDFLLIMDYYF